MICDMGIAKLREVTHTTVTTASKVAMGTYPYMAPEMFGSGHRNAAVDIYSLGCLYIELFGGNRVWPGISDGMQIMQKVCGSFHSAPEMPATSHPIEAYVKHAANWNSPDVPQYSKLLHY